MTSGPLHPIPLVAEAMRLMHTGEKEPFEIAPEGVASLRAQLLRLLDAPDLPQIVLELCMFAGWLSEEKKSPAAAEALFQVAELSIDALKKHSPAAGELAERLAAQRKDVAKVTGYEVAGLNPQEAPAGSVSSGPFARFQLNPKKK